jgi:hypothetical protein
LDKVGKSRLLIFSMFDLTSGFWQQSLQEKSRQYTAFSVPGKGARYQWRVTPMGLQGSPASFARLKGQAGCHQGFPNADVAEGRAGIFGDWQITSGHSFQGSPRRQTR